MPNLCGNYRRGLRCLWHGSGEIGFEADAASVQAEEVTIDIHWENVQLHVEYYPEQYRMTVTYPAGSQIEAEPLRKKDIRALAATCSLKAAYDMSARAEVEIIAALDLYRCSRKRMKQYDLFSMLL